MIYKFKCKASGDVIMLGPHGDQLMRLIGREPQPKGIIEPAAMPGVLQALEAAVAAEAAQAAGGGGGEGDAEAEGRGAREVSLRQRVWPMVEMLRRAHAEQQPVVWGV